MILTQVIKQFSTLQGRDTVYAATKEVEANDQHDVPTTVITEVIIEIITVDVNSRLANRYRLS
jgi:FKBP-type peptidyl-prolyl cis-trans isomerase 2